MSRGRSDRECLGTVDAVKLIDRLVPPSDATDGAPEAAPPFRWWVNIVWWVCLAGPVNLALALDSGSHWLLGVALLSVAIAAVLRLRYTVPVGAFVLVVVLTLWAVLGMRVASSTPQVLLISLTFLSYLVGRRDHSPLPVTVQLGVASVVCLIGGPLTGFRLMDWLSLVLTLTFLIIFPWLVGRYRYQHARLSVSGWRRAEQLEREQQAVAAQARLRERARIAEDMHDSLGHELSLIALRAAALEIDPALPSAQQGAAGELRQSAAIATERLREIIGLLREDATSITPVDETIADLVTRARESGMTITLTHDAGRALPRRADRAAHRVVQEALTNAAKHAPGVAVMVTVEHDDDITVVRVVNDLAPGTTGSGIGNRTGLVGLAERVRLAGGGLTAVAVGGRFVVTARLPHDADAQPVAVVEPLSESAQRHVAERRRTRQRLITVFAIPTVLMVTLGVVSLATSVIVAMGSTMTRAEYAEISIGTTREELEDTLPMFETIDPPTWVKPPKAVAGLDAECLYYDSEMEPTMQQSNVYRFCFVDGVLRSKDIVTS